MKMGHKKHGHCTYAQVEDAPKVLGHASISKGAVRAMAGGGHQMAGTIIIGRNLVQFTEESKQGLIKSCTPAARGLEELFLAVLERFLETIHNLRVYCKN
jgi:hypothetical protein